MNAVLQQLAGLRIFQSGIYSCYNFLKEKQLESTETLYYALYSVMGKVRLLGMFDIWVSCNYCADGRSSESSDGWQGERGWSCERRQAEGSAWEAFRSV